MSSDRQLSYVNDLQNRDQKLYYIDDASELNSINLKENDKIYAINDNKLFQMEIADQEEELSGPIVSFNGRNNTKIKSLVANIEPVQDLHGYNHPWPAGGGANKWNENWEAGTINVTNGVLSSASNAIRSASYSACTPNTEYYLFCGAGSSRWFLGICWYDANYQFISGSYNNRNTVTSPENAAYFKITTNTSDSIYGGIYNNNIAINYPATVTTYSPYSNECPISGWTGAEITQAGKNLFDPNAATVGRRVTENGDVQNIRGFVLSDYIPVKAKYNYYFQHICGSSFYYSMYFYAQDKSKVGRKGLSGNEDASGTVLTPAGAAFVRVNISGNIDLSTVQITIGDTAPADYTAFTGSDQISVTFPTSAGDSGTVYGGMFMLNPDRTGTLVVDRAMEHHNESDSWVEGGSAVADGTHRFYITGQQQAIEDVGICSIFKLRPYLSRNDNNRGEAFYISKAGRQITTVLATNVEEWKTWLQNNGGIDMVIKLANPQTYHLTATEVSGILTSFYGTNNIWSDIGDITVKIAEKGITAFELKPYT